MLEGLIEPIAAWTIRTIENFGYFGIFITMAIESASIPLPSEIIMPFSGFLVSQGKLNFILVAFTGAAGNLFGSIIMYGFGYWGQEALVRKFVRGPGRILIDEHELAIAEKWFRKWGDLIVLVSRILPVVRTFISLPAGVAKVPFVRFCVLTFIGSFFWSAFLTYIGVVFGENWQVLEPLFRRFDYLILLVIFAVGATYLYLKFNRLRSKHKRS